MFFIGESRRVDLEYEILLGTFRAPFLNSTSKLHFFNTYVCLVSCGHFPKSIPAPIQPHVCVESVDLNDRRRMIRRQFRGAFLNQSSRYDTLVASLSFQSKVVAEAANQLSESIGSSSMETNALMLTMHTAMVIKESSCR